MKNGLFALLLAVAITGCTSFDTINDDVALLGQVVENFSTSVDQFKANLEASEDAEDENVKDAIAASEKIKEVTSDLNTAVNVLGTQLDQASTTAEKVGAVVSVGGQVVGNAVGAPWGTIITAAIPALLSALGVGAVASKKIRKEKQSSFNAGQEKAVKLLKPEKNE